MSSGRPKYSHNKKRNSGLAYEFLVRKMSECLIDRDSASYKRALSIITEFYTPGKPLALEKQMFDTIMSTRGVKWNVARGVLNEVLREAKRLPYRSINGAKNSLIREVHRQHQMFLLLSFSMEKTMRLPIISTVKLMPL